MTSSERCDLGFMVVGDPVLCFTHRHRVEICLAEKEARISFLEAERAVWIAEWVPREWMARAESAERLIGELETEGEMLREALLKVEDSHEKAVELLRDVRKEYLDEELPVWVPIDVLLASLENTKP